MRYLCDGMCNIVEERLQVDDRAFLSIFTGCDVTDSGDLGSVLDDMVAHSEERIAALNAIKEKIASYEKALANSKVPRPDDTSSN